MERGGKQEVAAGRSPTTFAWIGAVPTPRRRETCPTTARTRRAAQSEIRPVEIGRNWACERDEDGHLPARPAPQQFRVVTTSVAARRFERISWYV
jgi:hypothetical protein